MLAVPRTLVSLIVLLAVALGAATQAAAAPKVDGEFAIPSGVASDNAITEGPDGNMWVTTQDNNKVARITPAGDVQEFDSIQSAFGIAAGPDGNLWVSTGAGVVKIPPANPANAEAFDVGLSTGRGIVAGPDGRMWVAGTDELISFDPTDPTGTKDENTVPGLQAKDMAVGTDGLLWIADANGQVISATAEPNPTFVPYDVQSGAQGGAQGVGAGPNGQIAYAAPTTVPQTAGRLTPGGTPLKTNLPNGSDPFGVTFAPDGTYWITRFQMNNMLRLTPDGQTSTFTGFAANGGPRKVATGPNDTLWVTLDTAEKVARISGVEPPVTEPKTKLGKKPKKKLKAKDKRNGKKGKAKAKFKFSSPSAGAKFECSLRPQGKAPKFKQCKSPKKYKVKPGEYEFQVRAVLAGERDKSPAKFKFEVVRKKRG